MSLPIKTISLVFKVSSNNITSIATILIGQAVIPEKVCLDLRNYDYIILYWLWAVIGITYAYNLTVPHDRITNFVFILNFCKLWKTIFLLRFSKYVIPVFIITYIFCNCIGGAMVSVLASSMVNHRFNSRLGQTKEYKIGMCCFSVKHAALRRKNKDWLVWNQDNLSEWDDMSICGLLFQWCSTITIQLSMMI
jgi:hypothetical protein